MGTAERRRRLRRRRRRGGCEDNANREHQNHTAEESINSARFTLFMLFMQLARSTLDDP